MPVRHRFAVRQEGHGARAFAAYALQHGVIVARADAEIARDRFALALFRQNAGKETAAFLAAEALLAQRQGMGQWDRLCPLQPALGVLKAHVAAFVLRLSPDEAGAEVDGKRAGHRLALVARPPLRAWPS